MNPVQLIQSLINTESIQKASTVSLKPGQLLYGKVVKFLPNETALIQIGSERFFAQVKASLTTEDHYWFEVRSSGDAGTLLKVVEGKGQTVSADFLLKHFHLPETKQNLQLVQFFLSENVPFTIDQLKTAISWISRTSEAKELMALAWMSKRDLPYTKEVFHSLVAVQDPEPLSQQLSQVKDYLDNPGFSASKSIQSLKEMISTILGNYSFKEGSTGTEIKKIIQTMVQSLGIEYEKDVQLWSKQEKSSIDTLQTLKPLVMEAMSELGERGTVLEPLLDRLTGLQLISHNQTDSIQQMVMQIPMPIGERLADLTIQWNGRKTSNGQIDADYCRVLFYLDLQSMSQTVIDMQIQNRVIHVSVINDTDGIEPIITALTPTLKEKLEGIGYKLSFIQVVSSFEKSSMDFQQWSPNLLSNEIDRRLDIKI